MHNSDDESLHGMVNITHALRTGAFSAAAHATPPQHDPNGEVRLMEGCALMGFSSREEYKAKRKGQLSMIARGEKILGAVLPIPHEKNGSKFFYWREIDAYNAAKKSAG